LTAIGSLKQATIRFANQDHSTVLTDKFEIISLNGTIAIDTLRAKAAEILTDRVNLGNAQSLILATVVKHRLLSKPKSKLRLLATFRKLQINGSPDFETKSSYSIRVKTTDNGGLTFEKALTINVNDLNEIFGTTGNNNLVGTANNDYIDGSAGNDTLIGGAGVDTLIGGTGNDTYIIALTWATTGGLPLLRYHLPLFLFDAGKLLKSCLAIEAEDSSQELAIKN
jgi:Ca2+-binding RTX toxin-like protein